MTCCDASGGRVTINADGKIYSSKGGITMMPSTTERSAEANDDGSKSVKTKAVLAECEFTLVQKCGLRLQDLTEACSINVTLDFLDMREKWFFTNARAIGRPQYKSESGEITGLKIVSDEVQGPISY